MVIFHFIYDLKFFGYVDWNTPDGHGWRSFRHLILISFFLCLGASLHLTHAQSYQWKKFWKRWAQIAASAGIITATSLIMVPANYIYFGVLHFIAIASMCCVLFAPFPKTSLAIGTVIIAVYQLGFVSGLWPFTTIRPLLPAYSNDYVGIFPWLGVVFLGIYLASTHWLRSDPFSQLTVKPHLSTWLTKPGQHSLIIYLLHQPLFFAVFGGIAYLTN
ncbi:DUF1624 domain-containing protein [Glaciecola sp. MH2013]|nr:DUF1624 domain-containing protein [Glaciecola sp. MH2013]